MRACPALGTCDGTGCSAPYRIGGFVWEDNNENGRLEPSLGENGYGGAEVRALLPDRSLFDNAVTRSEMSGGYYSLGVVEGDRAVSPDYIVAFTIPIGYRMARFSSSEVPVDVFQSVRVDFGIIRCTPEDTSPDCRLAPI